MAAFDSRQFRDALGHFATGVAIVTATTPDGPLGATISSFNSVSLAPPLVLFSIARSARSLAHWQAAEHYGVTVLSEYQTELSNRFARSGDDKWEGVTHQTMENGAPLLSDWLAYFECRQHARHDGGDHEIFLGRVLRFRHRPSPSKPLVFYNGRYCTLKPEADDGPLRDADVWLHGW